MYGTGTVARQTIFDKRSWPGCFGLLVLPAYLRYLLRETADLYRIVESSFPSEVAQLSVRFDKFSRGKPHSWPARTSLFAFRLRATPVRFEIRTSLFFFLPFFSRQDWQLGRGTSLADESTRRIVGADLWRSGLSVELDMHLSAK